MTPLVSPVKRLLAASSSSAPSLLHRTLRLSAVKYTSCTAPSIIPQQHVLRSMSTSAPADSYKKVLSTSSINPHVLNVEYAVRGELSNRAGKYADLIQEGKGEEQGLKFKSVVTANIGNPQQQPYLAQKPLTFWRQVAALTEYPALLDDESGSLAQLFPSDARKRAKDILHDIGSVGAYSHSKGAASIRKHVAEFIEERDGYASDPELIYLTAGASGGVQLLLSVLISGPDVGVMIPIPQYPLYSAALAFNNAHAVRYELNSARDWDVDVDAMARTVDEERKKGVDVRSVVVINPGNPTGSCLSLENIQDIIKLAHDKQLVIMADEVYQRNIFQPEARPFISFKKVLRDFRQSKDEKERRIAEDVEMISFHSISKGVSGECGRRGGYFELCNIDAEVEAEVYKMASVNLCPSLQGQIGIDLLVRPPKKGEPSYNLFVEETEGIHKTLMERGRKMREQFEKLPGVTCNEAQGALYLFPEIKLPPKALKAAAKENRKPDLYYCLRLLDATGICVVPGSGFGKEPGENGECFLRTTFLAKETDEFVNRFADFHNSFMKEFS